MKTIYTIKKLLFVIIIFSNSILFGQCWKTITATENRTLAIQNDGTLWSWGRNNLGSLGDGTNFNRYVPYQISTQTDWEKIAVSQDHFSFAIKTDGTLWGWGNNSQGNLANGTTTGTNTPGQIGTSTWKDITCGISSTLGIKTDGTLWGWGYNYWGQLGTGNTNSSLTPQLISSENWKMVSLDLTSSFAIKEDGTLWSCGDNTYGQLGYGTLNASYSLVQVGTANDWKVVVAGNNYTMAIKNNGTLWGWGRNFSGALGDGTTTDKLAPIQIGIDLWDNIALGEQQSTIGIKIDHTLWGWGYNGYGQLTNLSDTYNGPSQIGTATDWKNTAMGFGHAVISKLDGMLYSSGYNLYGQVGDNTNVDKNSLTNVVCTSLSNDSFAENLKHFSTYPNPFTDMLFFDTNENSKNIIVYDLSGRIVHSSEVLENSVNLSELKTGQYIVKIQTEKAIINTKIIKN